MSSQVGRKEWRAKYFRRNGIVKDAITISFVAKNYNVARNFFKRVSKERFDVYESF